jgi:hypothetical protein
VQAVCPDILHYKQSAVSALRELSGAKTIEELLESAHVLWCGPGCAQSWECTFLYHSRIAPTAAPPRSVRSRYNKETAILFPVMGGLGYAPGTSKAHEVNVWPFMQAIVVRTDAEGGANQDYADWSKKHETTAATAVSCACRDTIQWMATWCGERYDHQPVALHYIAFSTICDDLCIPPLDLVSGRFRMYGRSIGDLASAMDSQGWGRDGVHALLSLVRQYIVQYVEKVDFGWSPARVGLHARLNEAAALWDAILYRTHTANTYGAAIVVGRVCESGPSSFTWLMDSAICDALSMDLCKSAMDVYQYDDHQPTAGTRDPQHREAAYHSVYLDLIDDLVFSGAPDTLVHFGRAGFLFVQLLDRYLERRSGYRVPIRPAMAARLRRLFGEAPTDHRLDERVRQRSAQPLTGKLDNP